MPESNKHIVNEPQPDYEKAEMDLLRDGLNRSPEERFIFLSELIKTQQVLQSATVSFKLEKNPNIEIINLPELEPIKFLKQLQKNNVKYILTGDFAMCLYGHDIGNGILGVWLEHTTENLHLLKEVFDEHKIIGIEQLEQLPLLPDNSTFSLHNGMRLEICSNMKGLESFSFDECLELASIADIDDVQVPFLHINRLIANKVAVNRPKDQLYVIYLEKIKKMLEDSDSGTKG